MLQVVRCGVGREVGALTLRELGHARERDLVRGAEVAENCVDLRLF